MATALIIGIVWYHTYSKQLYDSLDTFLLSTTIYNKCIWRKNWREMTLCLMLRGVIYEPSKITRVPIYTTEMGKKGCIYHLRRLCSIQKWSRLFLFFLLLTAGPLKTWLSLRSLRTNALGKSINKSLLWREMFEITVYEVF